MVLLLKTERAALKMFVERSLRPDGVLVIRLIGIFGGFASNKC